jgi:hypothetical protein
MAANLTSQVRSISNVTKAVARGELEIFIDVEAQGEILELKHTVNSMVIMLSRLANEVSRISKEVGTEGMLGGQANVPGLDGMWKVLADNVSCSTQPPLSLLDNLWVNRSISWLAISLLKYEKLLPSPPPSHAAISRSRSPSMCEEKF